MVLGKQKENMGKGKLKKTFKRKKIKTKLN